MADHAEEQEMEAEALQAIFDTHFSILGPGKWSVEIYPEMTADYDELDQLNHVGVTLLAELPDNYPEALPVLDCQILKGLVDEHKRELLELAKEEAAANEGVPSIYAITERLRDWLVENNQKGLDDLSMHAQMLRKQQAKEREKKQAEETVWETQDEQEEMTAVELEEMAVQKRRAEGTPCNKENFEAWKARFEAEMAKKNEEEENDDTNRGGPKRIKKHASATVDRSDRITGFEYFKTKATNMDALEAAAEAAGTQEMDEDEEEENDGRLDVDEELFEDDVDLDDLDFDDDDDEDEEDVDI